VKPTDIGNPDYFHKVVDCQWACPAHTPVPEYIRLIAAGRYGDAYMVNWKSNVFPGILGRTCDRPCEPACRRGRVEEDEAKEPVAICRLKRVAADLKEDIRARLPKPAAQRNGKRVACVGAGPASLTVARDLAPLGYDVVVFDGDTRAGGMIRSQIPKFRLPEEVIDEEVGYILDLGVAFHGGSYVGSLKALLAEGWDAVFVGCGAPRGRDLEIPGRKEAAASIHIGIDWLSSVSFGHVDRIGKRVIVLGGGNTAMDCCRSSKRLGGEDVKVIVRSGFEEMKASPWEKEDAMHEGIPILNFLVPKAFLHENGKLTGMTFEKVQAVYDARGRRNLIPTGEPDQTFECDDVLIAVGQENAFPWIERDIGIEFDKWGMPKLDDRTLQSTLPHVFFGGDAALGPKNIIWAVADREPGVAEDGDPRVELRQRHRARQALQGAVARREPDAEEHPRRGRDGFRPEDGVQGSAALPQLRRADGVHLQALHRVRRVRRHLPDGLHHVHRGRRRAGPARAAARAGGEHRPGSLRVRRAQDRARDGEGRGRLPALRPVRRALPDRRVGHAEVPARADARRAGLP
jgi:NADPH-dependent glutamate synthase beta subunit-like oxidoreductase